MASRGRVLLELNAVAGRLKGPPDAIRIAASELTIDNPAARFTHAFRNGRWDGKVRFLRRPANVFPAGFAARLATILEAENFEVNISYRSEPATPGHRVGTPFPALAGIEELFAYQTAPTMEMVYERAMRLSVRCGTGGGKTEIAAVAAAVLCVPTFWMVHLSTLLDQTIERLKLRLPGWRIEPLQGTESARQLHHIMDDVDILVAMVQTASNLVDRAEELPEGFWEHWRFFVVDEVQHQASRTWVSVADNLTEAYWRMGLSGTIPKDPIKAALLEGVVGPVFHAASLQELTTMGRTAKVKIVLGRPPRARYPTYPEVREAVCPSWRKDARQLRKLGGALYKEAYRVGIVENKERNAWIVNRVAERVRHGDRCFITCVRKNHGKELLAKLKPKGWAEWVFGDTKSEVRQKALKAFANLESGGSLIGSVIFDEGLDVPEIDRAFLAGAGASEIATGQRIGRAVRVREGKDHVEVEDVLDGNDPTDPKDYLAQHTLDRLQVYINEGFEMEVANVEAKQYLARCLAAIEARREKAARR